MIVVAMGPEEVNLDQRKKTGERRSSSIHFLFDTLLPVPQLLLSSPAQAQAQAHLGHNP
jgi:hypothetical protein